MRVATVLTVYGIETSLTGVLCRECRHVATVLTVYGIETLLYDFSQQLTPVQVATVLTVYGIET